MVSRPAIQRGFTLIEVVVAFAILALSLGALFETFSGAMRRGVQAREAELAWLLMQSVLAELRVRGSPAEPHQFGQAHGMSWDARIELHVPDVVPGQPWQPYEVTIRVSHGHGQGRTIELRSVEWLRSLP